MDMLTKTLTEINAYTNYKSGLDPKLSITVTYSNSICTFDKDYSAFNPLDDSD